MSAAADRNLLFGILALQMDFISRDQLIAAMNSWILRKDRSLGELLTEQGVMTSGDCILLSRLVDRHVARHGGDPSRSLAVLSSVAPAREVLSRVADPDVQASLGHVPDTVAAGNELPSTVAPEFACSTEVFRPSPGGTRYQVERPHARGGLGEVFVARDTELNRVVALKHIQDRHADDPVSQSLFLMEGEVTGSLEHPGIIPVYGLGRYADGRPFYAMRFVQGDSLLRAIERFHQEEGDRDARARNLAFRGLLERFLDVCQAVAYAHRRGVLHRDLKPGNVLLGEFGETLVIDWGMAKVLNGKNAEADPSLAPTGQAGGVGSWIDPVTPQYTPLATVGHGAHGTPGYMSPEQVAGRIEELGPATDVYGLGAILFHLLTGRPPLTRQEGNVLERTLRGELPRPRQVKPDVPPGLEAVCRKALALRPGDRYPAVSSLAEDVRLWLADEPVSAFREPVGVRARRWVRKNPGKVAGIGATVLVGLLAMLVGATLLEVKNRDLESANSKLDGANESLRLSNTELDTANARLKQALAGEQAERRRADDRTRLANDRFTLALEAFKQQVFEADAKLQNRPGTQQLRKAILGQARQGLEKLVREAQETRGADHTGVWAHLALGDVYHDIDGQVELARAEYERALAISRKLMDADPNNDQAQSDLSASHSRLGNVLFQQGKVSQALEQYQHALEAVRKRAAGSDDAHTRRALGILHQNLGDVVRHQGDPGRALKHYQEALAITRKLADEAPRSPRALSALASSHERMGDVLLQLRKPDAARDHYQELLQLSQKLGTTFPEDVQSQLRLAIAHDRLGDTRTEQKDWEGAMRHYDQGLQVRQKLAAADPEAVSVQRALSVSHTLLGNTFLQLRQDSKAVEHYQRALAISQKLASDSQDAWGQRALATAHKKLGNVLLRQGEAAKSREHYSQLMLLSQKVAAVDPQNLEAQTDLGYSYASMGTVEQEAGEPGKAAEWYEKAHEVFQPLEKAGKLRQTNYRGWAESMRLLRATCRTAERSLGDLQKLLELPPQERDKLLIVRAEWLVRRGQHAEAVVAAGKLEERAKSGEQYYQAATAYGWCLQDRSRGEQHARKVMQLLGKARDAGAFADSARRLGLPYEEAFRPMRQRDDFKQLLAELK